MRFATLIFLCVVFCSGLSTFAETVRVDFSFATTGQRREKNALVWQFDKDKTNDSYDVISGASTSFSTNLAKSSKLPDALQKLFLFAVSPSDFIEKDAFTIEESEEGLDISFVHRGVAYWIEVDKKGNIDFENGCSFAVIGERIDGVFCIKDEFRQNDADNTDMHNVDWENVEFENDKIKEYAGYKLTHSVAKVQYIDGILTIKARLKWKKEK